MTKHEYLAELLKRLQVLPENESTEALAYYSEYLSDAGDEAAAAMERLGTPAEVAAKIIGDYTSAEIKELTEEITSAPQIPKRSSNTVLNVILIICASPFIISAAAIAISLIASLFAVVVTFIATGGALIVAGIAYIPLSVAVFAQNAVMAIAVLGSGFVLIAVGLALLKVGVITARYGFGGTVKLINRFLPKKRFENTERGVA